MASNIMGSVRDADATMAAAQAANRILNDVYNPTGDTGADYTIAMPDTHGGLGISGFPLHLQSFMSKACSKSATELKKERRGAERDAHAANGLMSLKDQGDDRRSSIDPLSSSPILHRHLIDDSGEALKLPKMIIAVLPDLGQHKRLKTEHSLPSVREIIEDLRRDDEPHPRRRRARGLSYAPGIEPELQPIRPLPRSSTEGLTASSMYPTSSQFSPASSHSESPPVLHFAKPAFQTSHSAPESISRSGPPQSKVDKGVRLYGLTLLSGSSSEATNVFDAVSRSTSLTSNSQAATGDALNAMDGNYSLHDAVGGSFVCTHPECHAAPFSTQYLLNSHANVHSQSRPHYCPVEGCSHAEGGKGFKRKNEMIRHGLVHQSPGYVCPFCPAREHKYPRPDNLQRHVRMHHEESCLDDPQLREILAQKVGGGRGRRRRTGA